MKSDSEDQLDSGQSTGDHLAVDFRKPTSGFENLNSSKFDFGVAANFAQRAHGAMMMVLSIIESSFTRSFA